MTKTERPVKVFLVDDDPIYTYATKKMLELDHHGIAIHSFENGLEVLEALNEITDPREYPDYIFLDINMPVMNGWEFLEAYEQKLSPSQRSMMKIFIVTSSELLSDQEMASASAHVETYLVKPLKKEVIVQIFRERATA